MQHHSTIAHCCSSTLQDAIPGSRSGARGMAKDQLGYTLRAIDELRPGDHICFLYESVEEHRTVSTQFVRGGIAQNHKIVYIGDLVTKNSVLNYFADSSIDIQSLIAKGQFEFLTYDQAYVTNGIFNPDAMVKLLQQTVDDALERGFAGERILGEMTWILKHLKDYDEVVRYESMVNKVFEENNALAVCQYNRHLFDSQLLLNIINVHPLACVGMELYDNFYYIPPTDWSANDKPAVFLKYWLRNLRDRKKVEEELNLAKEVALSESKAKTEFLNSMSHEIRTPLNGLIGTGQILKQIFEKASELPSSLASMANSASGVPDTDSSVQSLLKTMEICSNHLLSVVNDVLDLSRIPHSVPEGSEFSLFQCIDESLRITGPRAKSKNITVALDIESAVKDMLGPEGNIMADESGLRKVLINLIGNATKFTNPGGEIRVEFGTSAKGTVPKEFLAKNNYTTCPFTGQQGAGKSSSPNQSYTRLHCAVKDNGIGIPPEHLPRIFRAFSRVENARDSHNKPIEGTGLGLVISKQLVGRMGGEIWVESEGSGKGTSFNFWVWIKAVGPKKEEGEPKDGHESAYGSNGSIATRSSAGSSSSELSEAGLLSHSASTKSQQELQSRPQWHTGGEQLSDVRILVADDNAINRRILQQFLKSFKYKHITQCEDGKSAVDHVKSLLPPSPAQLSSLPSELPSVILLDYRMPHMTGSETARALRTLYQQYGLPLPFMACLTAAVLENEMKECLESGIEEVMIKPLRWADVGERLFRWGGIVQGRWGQWGDGLENGNANAGNMIEVQ